MAEMKSVRCSPKQGDFQQWLCFTSIVAFILDPRNGKHAELAPAQRLARCSTRNARSVAPGGYLPCIRETSFLFVGWKRMGIQAGCGDHRVAGTRISSLVEVVHVPFLSGTHRCSVVLRELCTNQ